MRFYQAILRHIAAYNLDPAEPFKVVDGKPVHNPLNRPSPTTEPTLLKNGFAMMQQQTEVKTENNEMDIVIDPVAVAVEVVNAVPEIIESVEEKVNDELTNQTDNDEKNKKHFKKKKW